MIKRKTILMSLLIFLPMVIAIGFSAWIIVYEVIISPNYVEPDLISQFFNTEQSTTYNGEEQCPVQTDGDPIDIDSISYQYKLKGQNDSYYTEGKPINANVYDVLITVTGEINGQCKVSFTINKAEPIITKKPSINSIYEGEMATLLGGTAIGIGGEDDVLSGNFHYTLSAGTTSLSYIGTGTSSSNNVNVSFTPSGESAINYTSVTFSAPVTMEPVAFIEGGTRAYYGTIEKALNAAISGKEVYVIPELAVPPTIKTDCEVKSGVKLILPYTDTTYNGRPKKDTVTNGISSYADRNQTEVDKYRKNQIYIAQGVKLSVASNATLFVGGVIGNEDQGLTSNVSGNYSEITMDSNSKIEVRGTLECMGYIKEKNSNNGSSVEAVSGGEIKEPFVINDYRGGTSTAGAFAGNTSLLSAANAEGNISPFNTYTMPNIQPALTINYGTSLIGYCDLYTGALSVSFINIPAQHNLTEVSIVGNSDSIINLISGARFVGKYLPADCRYTNSTLDRTRIELYGGANSGSMALSVNVGIQINMTTKNVYFPVPWQYDIELYNGTYNFNNKLKFLTGSSLKVNNGAVLNVNQSLVIYDEFTDTTPIGYLYPSKPEAYAIIDGEVNINAPTGGKFITSNELSIMNINNNNDGNPVTSSEGYGTRDGLNLKYNTVDTISVHLNGPFVDAEGNVTDPYSSFEIYTYLSNGAQWYKAEGYTFYTITFNANTGKFSDNNTKKSQNYPIKENSSKVLSSISFENPIKTHYYFDNWYLDEQCTQLFKDYTINAGDALELYANYELTQYSINYEFEYQNNSTSTDYDDKNNPIDFNIDSSSISISKPSDGTLIFYGWYLDSQYQKAFDISKSYTGLELYNLSISNGGTGDLTLYGYFTNIVKYTVSFNTDNEFESFESIQVNSGSKIDLANYNTSLKTYENDISYPKYFVGWYTDANCSDGKEFDSNSIVNKDLILYAKWNEKNVVSFYDEDGTTLLAEDQYYMNNTKLNWINNPVDKNIPGETHNTFKSFNCWNNSNGNYTSSDIYIIMEDVNFVAKYEVTYEYILTLQISNAKITINDATYTSNTELSYKFTELDTTFSIAYKAEKSGTDGVKVTWDKKEIYKDAGPYNGNGELNKHIILKVEGTNDCFVEGTLITLADGTKKAVEDLLVGEEVIVFNHESGKLDISPISFVIHKDAESSLYRIISLKFDNCNILKIVHYHGFFDKTLNKYVYINEENILDYIGHEFYVEDGTTTKLIGYSITEEYTRIFSPLSYYHVNVFANGILTVSNFTEMLTNIFEYDENMKYDEDLMKEDIEKYGLYTYEDFKEHASYELFCTFPSQYLKVSVGKGKGKYEDIIWLIETFINDY